MFARVTLFEIDTLRIALADAERMFDEQVLPLVEQQPGFMAVYVMRTPEGKGMLVSLWKTEQAAQAGIESGYYQEQVAKFLMFVRQPPGREHYEVIRARVTPEALTLLAQR
jgi:heme-degrading monooxygenase HmoA